MKVKAKFYLERIHPGATAAILWFRVEGRRVSVEVQKGLLEVVLGFRSRWIIGFNVNGFGINRLGWDPASVFFPVDSPFTAGTMFSNFPTRLGVCQTFF